MDQLKQLIYGRSLAEPARKVRTSFGEEVLLKSPYRLDADGRIVKRLRRRRVNGLRRRIASPLSGRVVLCLRWWIPEIFASTLSIITLIALIIVAHTYDGRGLQHINLPSSLTLNGLIAILSTINRVALMVPIGSAMSQETWLWFSEYRRKSTRHARLRNLEFLDSASRGAWGSFLLLFKAERRWLAHYGAIVTIISLAFGTFTQQLVTFVTLPVTLDMLKPGNIQHSESWHDFTGNPAEGHFSVPLLMKAATYNGILSSDQVPLNASCPTGNCTWPITPSLAICGACSSSTFKKSCPHFDDSGTGYAGPADGSCNYTMPSGSTAFLTSNTDGYGAYSFKLMPSNGAIYTRNDTNRLYIANFDLVNARNSPTQADECALWMCVQAYETRMLDSIQTQRSVQTFSDVITSHLGNSINDATNLTFRDLPSAMNPTPLTQYIVGADAQTAFQTYLSGLFTGNISYDLESYNPTSDIVEAISFVDSTTLNEWIQKLANSMTNVIRSNTPATSDLYNGTAYQLGVQIRWPWIILPLVLILSSILILLTAMIRTARSPVQAWKGSPLVMLFMGVDEAVKRGGSGKIDTYDGLSSAVGAMRVRIEVDGEGNWGFRGTGVDPGNR